MVAKKQQQNRQEDSNDAVDVPDGVTSLSDDVTDTRVDFSPSDSNSSCDTGYYSSSDCQTPTSPMTLYSPLMTSPSVSVSSPIMTSPIMTSKQDDLDLINPSISEGMCRELDFSQFNEVFTNNYDGAITSSQPSFLEFLR